MTFLTAEGIILQAFPFQENDRILTVFSLEEGIIKFIAKKSCFSKKGKEIAPAPLTQAEFTYAKKRSELFPCRELEVLNHHLPLREDLNRLEAACDLLQAILTSQWLGKPSPELYKLLCTYLEKMPLAANPFVISSSFRLKILKYEGMLKISPFCSVCGASFTSCFFSPGEFFCSQHAPHMAVSLSQEEATIIDHLAECTYFSQLVVASISSELALKIKQIFKECFDRL